MANETLFLIIILWGFVLGKLIPTNADGWRKWWYNRRNIAYFLVYIIEASKIIHRGIVKQSQTTFTYGKGKYVTSKQDPTGRAYSPTVELNNQRILFYNKNNTNPLEFMETRVTPSHNDPEIFRTIIKDTSIQQALSGEFDVSELKRFILITMGILGLSIAGIMYFLMKM